MPSFFTEFFEGMGIPQALVNALILPVLAALIIWALRLVFLSVIKRSSLRPHQHRRWRRVSVHVALVAGGLVFCQIWLASLEQIASMLDRNLSANTQILP